MIENATMPDRKLRVLFVNPLGALGGSERSLLDLFASLRRADAAVEPKLLSLAEGELVNEARELGVAVETLALPPDLATLGESAGHSAGRARTALAFARAAMATPAYLAAFRRAVHAWQPDLLHTNGMKAHWLAALATPNRRKIVHLRDFASSRPLSRQLLPLLRRRTLVLTNSRAVEADALASCPGLRTRVVYNGIDLQQFRPGPRELEPLAALAGLSAPVDESLVVGLVASYAWWKGHRTFLAAAARLVQQARRPLRFYVIGGPIYAAAASQVSVAELRGLIDSHGLSGHVGLVPFQRDVGRVYRGLDIAVHASERAEPFGRTIVEAMASERAVIVSRAGGAAELFEEGQSGLGFTPGDAEDLARRALELVDNDSLRLRLATAAHREAVARFDRNRLAGEVVAAYRALCADGLR